MSPNTQTSPQTDAGREFAAWVADRRPLTTDEIADILSQLQPTEETPAATAATPGVPQAILPIPGSSAAKLLMPQQWAGPAGAFSLLPPEIKTEDIKPTTKFGSEFQAWVAKRDSLTTKQLAEMTALLTALKKSSEAMALKLAKPSVPPDLIIPRTPFPKWWKTLLTAKISLTAAGTQTIVSAPGRFLLFIASIVLTVSGETNISFSFGVFGASGSLDLGGSDEPRGIVIALGDSPAPCGKSGFSITSSGAAVAVGGFCTYYLLHDK
jgi:hypothetical protein